LKLWWLRDYRRLAEEKAAVEAIVRDEPWFKLERWSIFEGTLTAHGVVTAHGAAYPVRLRYPDQFPEVPAWVEPQGNVRWSSHQYGSGSTLCLELRPDNWKVTATGADVLRSAYNLLVHESPLGKGVQTPAPSAHSIGDIQSYDWGGQPVLMSVGCRDRLMSCTARDVRALRWWMGLDDVWPIVVHDGVDRTSVRHPPGPDVASWRFEISVYASPNAPPADSSDRRSLLVAGGFDSGTSDQFSEKGEALVLFLGGPEVTAYLLLREGEPHRRQLFVLPSQGEARSGRPSEASAKRVTIVGVGSVGSKLAESLVRSGVSRLTLVDGDIMLPGNLERHTLDWRDVGFRKVHGVRRHLLHIAPGADISVIDENLNWQRSAKTHAWQVAGLAESDVIVDATGDSATSLFLGAVAAANRRPFVSVEVYEGGIGALVASCVPGRDPPFATARAAFHSWCEQQGATPPTPGQRAYEALAENGAPMVADDAAVTMAAGHAARVVLDILDGFPAGPEAAWMLIGFREGWVFKGHGDTIRMSVGEPAEPMGETQDSGAKAFVSALVQEFLSASPASE
jgi:hypothetical protein